MTLEAKPLAKRYPNLAKALNKRDTQGWWSKYMSLNPLTAMNTVLNLQPPLTAEELKTLTRLSNEISEAENRLYGYIDDLHHKERARDLSKRIET